MKKSRSSEEKIIGILREARSGMKIKDVCARHNISVQTYYGWKRKYGGMQVDGVVQARALSEENARLKRIVKLSRQHPRYGYRRITALLRREGDRVEREVYGTGAEG
jgi:putative transposase